MNRWGLSMGVSPREPLTNVTELARTTGAATSKAMWFIDFSSG